MAERLLLQTTSCLHKHQPSKHPVPPSTHPPTHPPAGCGSFVSLRSLLLGGNCLSSWASVDALDGLPDLAEARLSDNPLTAAAPTAARYQCIARVGYDGGAAAHLCYYCERRPPDWGDPACPARPPEVPLVPVSAPHAPPALPLPAAASQH